MKHLQRSILITFRKESVSAKVFLKLNLIKITSELASNLFLINYFIYMTFPETTIKTFFVEKTALNETK